jgi:tRNA-dihydrouridine synthase 1
MRILETREKTLEYARMILSAGASILTVHGRRREQKGHNTGVADWTMIRYLRDNLPPETVLFANGNILNSSDLETCLAATGVDGIMSAEGNLSDPTIFAKPPTEYSPREYWYGAEEGGRNGYRIDAVFRRYLDIIHKYCLEKDPPERPPLYIPGDPNKPDFSHRLSSEVPSNEEDQLTKNKRRKREANSRLHNDPNIKYIQGHLFQLLRPLLSIHTDIRDALARTRVGEIDSFERILAMVEQAIAQGMDEYTSQQQHPGSESSSSATPSNEQEAPQTSNPVTEATQPSLLPSASTQQAESASLIEPVEPELTATEKVVALYKRPWWVCQPHIRPLPEDAIRIGALTISKKKKEKEKVQETADVKVDISEIEVKAIQRTDEPGADDYEQQQQRTSTSFPLNSSDLSESNSTSPSTSREVPQAALVCG